MRTPIAGRDITTPAQTLQRFINAARLGSEDHGTDIREALIAFRDAVHGDEPSSLCELPGPLGSLERLLDEREGAEPDRLDPRWRARWHEALEAAAQFLRRSLR